MTTVKNYFKDGTLANTLTNVQVNGGNIDLTGIAWNGTKKADTFTVSDLSESVYIADKGGKDTLNFTDTTVKASDMKYAFNVEFNKKGNAVATDGLVITNADGLEAIAWKNGKADIDNGVIVEDYFGKGKVENVNVTVKNDEVTVGSDKYYTNKKGNIINADAYAKLSKKAQKGYSDLVLGKGDNLYSYKNGDKTVYTTDATRLSSVSDVTSNISAITNDVGNFLKANDYESAAEVLASTDDNAATQIAALKEIYNTGKNEYEFSAGDALYKKGKTTTTDAAAVATKAKGTFYTDGTAITKSATRSVKNNDVTVTTDAYYQSGTTIIAKDDYDKLTDKTGYTTVETSTKLYSYEDADGKTVYTTSETRTVDNEKVTGKVYSYTTGTGKDATTVYTTDATVAAAQWLTGSNKAQSVKDMAGNDTYTVDKTFDFTKDSLVISDMDGDNDVLNLSDSSDKYTVLFDVTAKKDGDTEGTSYVGKALYAIGKDQKDLAHGIQMTGIDKVNANGTEVTMADEIVSKVQSWLSNTENGKSAYASVADALADKNVNVADLIAAYAPQTTTGA